MKKVILFIFILSAFIAKGQTLKELLYSGKLKKDSSGVIRKTDDLKSKIDTTQKKTEPEKKKVTASVIQDSLNYKANTNKVITTSNNNAASTDTINVTPLSETIKNSPVKSNTKIWKEYTDSLAITLKNEVLSSKKIKKETYYFTVEYEIGTDGGTSIPNVIVTPENPFLLSHVQQKISDNPPRLSPVLNSAGQPQKVKRKHNFVITKD
jgi:hypothetical protein